MCLNFLFGFDDNRLYWFIYFCLDLMVDSVCLFFLVLILGRFVLLNRKIYFFFYRFKMFKISVGRVFIFFDLLYNLISDIIVVVNLKKNVEILGL